MKEQEDYLYQVKDEYFASKNELEGSIMQYEEFKASQNEDQYTRERLF